jgi:hypothetical protein
MIELVIAGAAAGLGYIRSRDFVASRLRFVDAAQSPAAPLVAGVAAAAVAAPVALLLPLVGAGTVLLFGAAVGVGTRAGVRRIRDGLYLGRGG